VFIRLAGRGGVDLTGTGRGERIVGLDKGLTPELRRARELPVGVPKSTASFSFTVICIPSYGESSPTPVSRVFDREDGMAWSVLILSGKAGSSFELLFDLLLGGGVLARLG
jgi:hypothetical protein